MRVSPAAEKPLRQRNQTLASYHALRRVENYRAPKRILDSDSRRPSKNESSTRGDILEKGVIGGVLDQNLAEVCL